ncbi:phosphotransferase [Myxococcus llanfairpwllgwyngyllgogerychwyrndrobwllllantysiliogogogochensis]|uniref:Phosphotransferase n=1 Tax=Myxococcus llanfairpwllgwyngyllgogerychwyrndrobwllllantysiliogogogochensis TaxID=2590453 RepID=A0A540X5H2_9BACT|nr:phosphotransferase [Myxococcus llanfairpwllgwyngyllgogerychwyrndrobwllllantysiliogogogochensis]TQF16450.1 phosphotransferase [Myxococcus llanfairpwllgwyngyllgogerychwyrndrobwllllantysiliogogogochensis]
MSGARAEGDWRGVVRDVRVSGSRVTKRATHGRDKLLREVAWLRELPPRAAERFPRVLEVRTGADWAEYDMDFCPWPELSRVLVDGTLTVGEAVSGTRSIVSFAFDTLYTDHHRPAPEGFFHASYVDKYWRRASGGRGLSARFDRLCAAGSLDLNGRLHRSAAELVRELERDTALLARLHPPRVGRFHGDFKFDNVLLEPATGRFLLLDPRGSTATGDSDSDYLEDLAKLRTCTSGLYDLARAGAARVSEEEGRLSWEWALWARPALERFAALDVWLGEELPARALARGDTDWRARWDFVTPLLLLANAPFQLAPVNPRTEDIALVLHATGVRLLAEALERHGTRGAEVSR